ncbi:L-arabinokinase [Arachis hypogaea]|nr:L-arabinokinase [Arachis hypogaea]
MVAIKMDIKMGMKQQEGYDGDGAAAVYSTQKMVFAYYVTGHEFGHATRVADVTSHFLSSFSLSLSFMIHYLDIALHLSLNCNFNFNCMYISRNKLKRSWSKLNLESKGTWSRMISRGVVSASIQKLNSWKTPSS